MQFFHDDEIEVLLEGMLGLQVDDGLQRRGRGVVARRALTRDQLLLEHVEELDVLPVLGKGRKQILRFNEFKSFPTYGMAPSDGSL